MTTIKSILRSLGRRDTNAPVRSAPPSREVEDELRFHIEMRTRDNIAAGMTPEEAAADAMRRFGDYDQLRSICEEIKKERLANALKVMKGVTWLMLGCGLTLKLATHVTSLQSVGVFLILIAGLWRLLIHLREIQPDQRRIEAAGQSTLSVVHTVGDFPSGSFEEPLFTPDSVYDPDGRTPVERVI